MNNITNMSQPKSKWQLFNLLYTGKLPLNELWLNWTYRYKFFLRTLFLSPITLKWFDKLIQYPLLGYYFSCQTNLPCKLQRPYLASCLSQQERFEALAYHYDFLARHPDSMTKAFYNPNIACELADVKVKNDANIKIAFQARNKFAREGEISLYFYDNDGIDLATITFTIMQYQQKTTLFIGGLQGTGHHDARIRVQQATKQCYGLFPKRVALEAALVIARYFNLEQIVAVGNKTHIYNNWRYNTRQERILSDYDDFWLTIDGKQDSNGLFILPNQIYRKSLDEIASKKRSEYRNRYALLDQLENSITENLALLK
ncbi:VirK/YbjX family protein [Gilliamella apicola]|uniref:VirK/YbjX family protein n=1 Tax=Gilliamella apicola TaxID=1196095 RepID=UPI002740A4E8|nr:VirK/YbjX family protein [Gilliamella apicola]WLS90858.1 VirK/YbjX family protein [Gilliamella apicola]